MASAMDGDVDDRLISYYVLGNGDTINRMYPDSVKSGKWFEDYTLDRSYYYEVGIYLDGLKEGEWKVYNSLDEMIESAIYHRGARNGRNVFYEHGKVIAIGDQVGMFYTASRDTIPVTDPDDYLDYATEIENNSYDLRNGTWVFLSPYTRDTTQVIKYYYGEVLEVIDMSMEADTERDSIIESRMPHRTEDYRPISKKPRKYYFPK